MELFLQLLSFWSKNFFFQIMSKLSTDGVNMQEGKLVRYKSFLSANECKTGQIVFLNQNAPRLPRWVSYYLEQFGTELRRKFMGVNTHPHCTLITKSEYWKVRQDRSWRVTTGKSPPSKQENIIKTFEFGPDKRSWNISNSYLFFWFKWKQRCYNNF